jgi:hypothetical protein
LKGWRRVLLLELFHSFLEEGICDEQKVPGKADG